MPRNIEIKARIESVDSMTRAVASAADHGPETIHQDDTFFQCPNGRLKLRAFADGPGELIFYQRPDQPGPKESSYVIVPVPVPDVLRDALSRAYGIVGRIRKVRTLYRIGRTRVHLDEVDELGSFLELEVVLEDTESVHDGEVIASDLCQRFGIPKSDLVDRAYVDLLP